MPLRKMRSRSLAVVELVLSLSVSSTCGTAGGKDKRPDYTAAYVTLYCLIIHTYAICFIHSSYHMDNIRSFLNVQLKCIWNIFEKPPWTMPLTTEIWIAVYMIRCRGLKLQDWHFRVDHCTLIYQNHSVFINRHCRAHTCQVDLQGMISLKLGIPVCVCVCASHLEHKGVHVY